MTVESELRRDRRVATELRMRFAQLGAGGEGTAEETRTTGVSSSGLSFVSRSPLSVGTRIRVDLSLPGGEPFSSEAVVVRIVTRDEDDGIEYGVRFDPALEGDRLSGYVRSIDITPLLDAMIRRGATHLYLCAGVQPQFRINRELTPAMNKVLPAVAVEALSVSPLNSSRLRELRRKRQIEFVHFVPGVGRWRVNVCHRRGQIEATFHAIASSTREIEDLGLPQTVRDFAHLSHGLVVITGHRGSGKSATIAALIEAMSRSTRRVIATVEPAVEYIHASAESLVQQYEVGVDARTTEEGVRFALRQDPDVLVVHEIDSVEVLDMAMHAAQSGRLVFVVVPGANYADAITWIETTYPEHRRDTARALLASSLEAILGQTLLPRLDSSDLILASEILLPNDGIRSAIRNGQLSQIRHLLTTVPGAQSLDVSLRNLVLRGAVDRDVALNLAHDRDYLQKMIAEL